MAMMSHEVYQPAIIRPATELFFRDDGSSPAWKCSIDRADNEPYYLSLPGPETQPAHVRSTQ